MDDPTPNPDQVPDKGKIFYERLGNLESAIANNPLPEKLAPDPNNDALPPLLKNYVKDYLHLSVNAKKEWILSQKEHLYKDGMITLDERSLKITGYKDKPSDNKFITDRAKVDEYEKKLGLSADKGHEGEDYGRAYFERQLSSLQYEIARAITQRELFTFINNPEIRVDKPTDQDEKDMQAFRNKYLKDPKNPAQLEDLLHGALMAGYDDSKTDDHLKKRAYQLIGMHINDSQYNDAVGYGLQNEDRRLSNEAIKKREDELKQKVYDENVDKLKDKQGKQGAHVDPDAYGSLAPDTKGLPVQPKYIS